MLKKSQGTPAFIPFIVAGHPSIEATEKTIDILVEEGANLIEVGVPFSDAMADGPVIQKASEEASKKLASVDQVLEITSRIHKKHPQVPLILFTYFNPLYRFGLEKFASLAKSSGIAAVLVVDLPPEEATSYLKILEKNSLKTIFLASPTTSESRLAKIADASSGFIYYVSRAGVTGVQNEVSQSLPQEIKKIRSLTDKSIAVGFGISNGSQAAQVAKIADAVVVGSAFVKLAAQNDFDSIRKLAREISTSIQNQGALTTK